MTQTETLLDLFRRNRGFLTLGEILSTPLAAEYRARMTDLRHKGFVITCDRGKRPSENLYRLSEKEESGQLRMIA